MLRNTGAESPPEASDFLNEVLSLNAQESYVRAITRPYDFPQ